MTNLLQNVMGSVAGIDGSLLLGQSFILAKRGVCCGYYRHLSEGDSAVGAGHG